MEKEFKNLSTPHSRIKYVRDKLLKLSRAEVFKKHGLSVDTLSAWESGKTQLTEKAIERCIKIFTAENLIVSREWLLTGEGLDPRFSFDLNRYIHTTTHDATAGRENDTLLLAKEIDFFRSLSPNSVTVLVPNDSMLPVYSRGDYVGGRFLFGKNILNCIGKDCIVKTRDDSIFVRRVVRNTQTGGYNLVCLNPSCNDNTEPVLFDVEISCAAPIIWYRRPDES